MSFPPPVPRPLVCVGLMSGTSLDGVDLALIVTDGRKVSKFGPSNTTPYETDMRDRLRAALTAASSPSSSSSSPVPDVLALERDMSILHAKLINQFIQSDHVRSFLSTNAAFLSSCGLSISPSVPCCLLGYSGQTLVHRPAESITQQIGSGAIVSEITGCDVIADLRRRDVAAGGQGAPLVPLFHLAISRSLGFSEPVAILNIGGVANITYIPHSACSASSIVSFDTGPGNALIDDFILRHTGAPFDAGGQCAAKGSVRFDIIEKILKDPFFDQKPPKSLDRNAFRRVVSDCGVDELSNIFDGAATLTALTAITVAAAANLFNGPERVRRWLVCGGGRDNAHLMRLLHHFLNLDYSLSLFARTPLAAHGNAHHDNGQHNEAVAVQRIDDYNIDGDSLEASAFAFLAARSYFGLCLSLPNTTGARESVTGGALYRGRTVKIDEEE